MIRSAAAAAAALVLCGLAMSAPSAAGAGGGSDDAAARASEERMTWRHPVGFIEAWQAIGSPMLRPKQGLDGKWTEAEKIES